MSNKVVIGTCSQCGGPVERYVALNIVGPFPPPQCRQCGSTVKQPYGPVVETEKG